MAAEMLTVDWRGRRYRYHMVWLCQSRSLRGRGRQFHRQEEGRGTCDEGALSMILASSHSARAEGFGKTARVMAALR